MKAYLTYKSNATNISEIVETEFEVLPKEGDEIVIDDTTREKLGNIIIRQYEYLYKLKKLVTRQSHVAWINELYRMDLYNERPMLFVNIKGKLGIYDTSFNTVGETKYIQIDGKFYPVIRICDWAKYHNN